MIVNPLLSGLELLYQPAHALLSARLAGRWRADARPARWTETLVAVAQHDNGWIEWERAPTLTLAGLPRNFTEITPFEAMAQWRRGVARGAHQGRWVGLLISRHATSLYADHRGRVPDLDEFLAEQEALQQAWQRALGVSDATIDEAYAMVRWSDWLSLVLCWRRLPDDGSAISLGEGSDGVRYAARRDDDVVRVDPWPFDESRFEVEVESRWLAEARYESQDTLRAALESAPIQTRRWTFAR